MSKFTVPQNGKIVIEIQSDAPTVAKKPGEQGYVGAEPTEDDPLVFRAKGNITLYDLGVRLGSHLVLSSIDQSPASSAVYNEIMLSGDYLESLKLPQHSEYLYVDLVFRKEDETDQKVLVGAFGKRPYVKDFARDEDPEAPFVGTTGWANASTRVRGEGQWYPAVDARFFYNSFDTKEPNFKVTSEPDYAVAGTDFTVNSTDKLEIYLTPRMYYWLGNISALGRLPVTPNFNAIRDAPIFNKVFISQNVGVFTWNGNGTDDFWQQLFDYFGDQLVALPYDGNISLPEFVGFELTPPDTPLLMAIIVRAGVAFYVWRTEPNEVLNDSRVGHPPS